MFNIVKMELKRLMFSKAFYATVIAYLLVIISEIMELNNGTEAVNIINIMGVLPGALIIISVFYAIFVSAYVHLDYQCGQIKNIVAATTDRSTFIVVKYVTLGVLQLIGLAICTLICACYAHFFTENGFVVSDMTNTVLAFIQIYIMLMFYNAVLILISTILKKELLCTLIGAFVGFGIPLLEQVIYITIKIDVSRFSVLTALMSFDASVDIGTRAYYIGLSIVYSAIVMILARVIMRKKDV